MRVARALASVLFLVVVSVAGSGAAQAAPETSTLTIRKIDASGFPTVKMSTLFTGPRPDLANVSLRENGGLVPEIDVVPVAESATPVGIVLVIDTSGSMSTGGRLVQAKAAAAQFVERKLPNDQIALVTFANEPRVAVNFTADPTPLLGAIEGLQAGGETALWEGVRVGANLFAGRSELLPYLVVLSDGADTVSQSDAAAASAAARTVQAGVFAIAITGEGESDAPALRNLADDSGGTFAETRDAADLGRIYSELQGVLQNQYEITWTSKAAGPSVDVAVKIGSAVADGSVTVNSVTRGSAAAPQVVNAPRTPGFLADHGPGLIALVVGLAAGLLGAFVILMRRDGPGLDTVLEAYTGGGVAPPPVDEERRLVPDSVRRAVERTAAIAGSGGSLAALDAKLDAADLKLRAQEAVVFVSAGVLALAVAAFAVGGWPVALAAVIVGALAPVALLTSLGSRRRKSFTALLPDALQLLASSLRAGYSLLQGLEAVADEIDDPMGRELRRVVLETRLGREIEVALQDLSDRMDSKDFEWVVMAIRIQREVGGNLAELLTSVAETMIGRERLRREVSALTAEGKLSAIIIGALPVVIGGVIAVLNPGYINGLFTTSMGQMMLLGATVLTLVGFVWMKKTIEIDV